MTNCISKIIIGFFLTITMIETASACSIRGIFISPSNYELVGSTEVIILAKAEKKSKKENYLDFKVLRVLKGNIFAKNITIQGSTNYAGKSTNGDFSKVRPGAMRGACNAYDYKLGASFLLFLNRFEDKWRVSGPAFTRINEEISNKQSPWLKAVNKYIEISSLNNYQKEKEFLKRTLNDESLNILGLKDDLESHFSTLSSFKSFDDLISVYNKSDDKNIRRLVLHSLNKGHSKKSKPIFEKLLEDDNWVDYSETITKYLRKEKSSEYTPLLVRTFINDVQINNKEHSEETPEEYQIRRLKENRIFDILFSLTELAQDKHKGLMEDVLEVASEEQIAIISKWFGNHPTQKAILILRKIHGGNYTDNTDLTLSLASMGDIETLNWAKKNINKDIEYNWLVRYVIARSPLKEAENLAQKVITNKNLENINSLLEGYAESKNDNAVSNIIKVLQKYPNNKKLNTRAIYTLTSLENNGNNEAVEYLKSLRLK